MRFTIAPEMGAISSYIVGLGVFDETGEQPVFGRTVAEVVEDSCDV